jgi:antitoxin component of MazEF toxin-antitoxin module
MSIVRRSDQKARVILPQDFASQLLIIERVNDSALLIKKGRAVRRRKYTFQELVSAITPENRHAETKTGSAVGKEILPPYTTQEKRRAR